MDAAGSVWDGAWGSAEFERNRSADGIVSCAAEALVGEREAIVRVRHVRSLSLSFTRLYLSLSLSK